MLLERRKWLIVIALMLPIVVLGWLAYSLHFRFTVTAPNAYALWYTGDLVVSYLREHRRGWPTKWDDLRPYWNDLRNTSGRPEMAFESLQELVEIDWKNLPKGFDQAKQKGDEPRTLSLIRRRDGRKAYWSFGEPHEIILFHLRSLTPFSIELFDPSKRLAKARAEISGEGTGRGRLWGLSEAGMACVELGQLDDAREYVLEALKLCEGSGRRDEDAIHKCHIVLGRVALRKNNFAEAESQLLKSGEVNSSAVLESFGPNMTLAKELLERDKSAAVLEYFTLCEKFWHVGLDTLKTWTNEVRAGRIPDFGANLKY